jgi:hypothetical protein
MDVKPSKGLNVEVHASREAIFGDEGVEVKKISSPSGKGAKGVMTGRTLVGYAEVEMAGLDAQKHWYPIDQIVTEKGDNVVEEEIVIEESTDSEEGEDSAEDEEE